ncbi:MAG: 16S rRNA (guanine(527)-N(7))-methyltransferase RsmG, partial [Bacteroidota bacterium]
FKSLEPLYAEWNHRINVISRKDMHNFYLHHVLHSLSIAKAFQFQPRTSVADIGTGGGFPGIPLAIFFPEVEFVLVDSIEKKIKVVQDVANRLNLDNVQCIRTRAENLEQKFDFIVSRAVTTLPVFMQWTKGKIKNEHKHIFPNGVIYLKGGDIRHEIAKVKQKHKIIHLSDFFEEDFFLTKKIIHLHS